MENEPQTIANMEFLSGRLALDFINTVEYREPRDGNPMGDLLKEPGELQLFLKRQSIGTRGSLSSSALDTARELRESLYRCIRLFMLQGGRLDATTLKQLNLWRSRLEYREVLELDHAKHLVWSCSEDDSYLAPIFHSALEILMNDDPQRLRYCPAHECGWLFYDTSKSGKRIWCDMADCGNREKAKRFYHQHRDR